MYILYRMAILAGFLVLAVASPWSAALGMLAGIVVVAPAAEFLLVGLVFDGFFIAPFGFFTIGVVLLFIAGHFARRLMQQYNMLTILLSAVLVALAYWGVFWVLAPVFRVPALFLSPAHLPFWIFLSSTLASAYVSQIVHARYRKGSYFLRD